MTWHNHITTEGIRETERQVLTRSSNKRINHSLMRFVGEPSPKIDHGIHARSRLRHPSRPSLGPQPLDLLLRRLLTTTVAGSLRLSVRHEAGELVGGGTGLGMRVGACGSETGCVSGGSGQGVMF